MVPFAVAGLVLWAVAGLVLLSSSRDWLVAHGHENWLWICLAGFLLGFPGPGGDDAPRRQPAPPPRALTTTTRSGRPHSLVSTPVGDGK